MSDQHPPTGPPSRANNLEYLRKKAKLLLRDAKGGDAKAVARMKSIVEDFEADSAQLSQAQLVIAREHGFASWPKLQDELRWKADVREKHRLGSASQKPSGEQMSKETSLNLGTIDQIGLTCTDLDEASRFYSELLGLKAAGDVPGTMRFFSCDGIKLVLFKSPTVAPNSIIYFRVPGQSGEIERRVEILKSKNVKIESEPHLIARNWNGFVVWLAFFRDPFGNLLALKSDVPISASNVK